MKKRIINMASVFLGCAALYIFVVTLFLLSPAASPLLRALGDVVMFLNEVATGKKWPRI